MKTSPFNLGEELANAITGGIGLLFSVSGAVLLVTQAISHGTVWHIVSCSVYAGTLILLHLASTMYHSSHSPKAKSILQVLDHAAIFLLIAGTYTPFTLVNLRGPWGWSLFGVIWGLALFGIAFQSTLLHRWPAVAVGLYVAMGWAVVVAVKPLLATVAPGGLVLLLVGGLAYTLGVGFYAWRRLPYHHAIWHLFVLAGSLAHLLRHPVLRSSASPQ